MKHTKIMGILNVTPDSFFEKSAFSTTETAIQHALRLAQDGADIIDIGGESSRPGASPINEDEELNRVIPVIKALKQQIAIPISIDTIKPRVAAEAIKAGASLINDISGFENPEMQELAASLQLDICVMHMQGTPQTMQVNPCYPDGVVHSLLKWFEKKVNQLMRYGISENQIIIDPGIGFGKTVADNLKIIHNLPQFKALGFRLLVGASRKSFLAKIVGKPASELLSATLAINSVAVLGGADILRVHDVVEHCDMVALLK